MAVVCAFFVLHIVSADNTKERQYCTNIKIHRINMKKFLFSLCLLSLVSTGFAQTSDFSNEDGRKTTIKNAVGLSYHSFKGANNFGIFAQMLNPKMKGWGMEMGFRSSFKEYGNYSVDWGANYSLLLYQENDIHCLLTLGAGFSFRFYKKPEVDKKGNVSHKLGSATDIFADPRICLIYKRLMFIIGYSMCSNQWRFDNDNRADGLLLGVGYCF